MTGPALRETAPPVKSIAKPLSAGQKLAVQAFHTARSAKGEDVSSVHLDSWRQAFNQISTADSDEAKRKAFSRARKDMQAAGILLVDGDFYTLTGEHARPDDTAFAGAKPRVPRPKT